MASFIDMAIKMVESESLRDMVSEGAKIFYSDTNVTLNLIPGLIIGMLGLLLMVPLLSSVPKLFEAMGGTGGGYGQYGLNQGAGYGAPPSDGYVASSGYGSGPEYRSFQDDGLMDTVNSYQSEQEGAYSNPQKTLQTVNLGSSGLSQGTAGLIN